jgi:hypothetical protein
MSYEQSDRLDRNSSDRHHNAGVAGIARDAYDPSHSNVNWNQNTQDTAASVLPNLTFTNGSPGEGSSMQNAASQGQNSWSPFSGTMGDVGSASSTSTQATDSQSGNQQNLPAELQQLEVGIQQQLKQLGQEITQLQTELSIPSQTASDASATPSQTASTTTGGGDASPVPPVEATPTPGTTQQSTAPTDVTTPIASTNPQTGAPTEATPAVDTPTQPTNVATESPPANQLPADSLTPTPPNTTTSDGTAPATNTDTTAPPKDQTAIGTAPPTNADTTAPPTDQTAIGTAPPTNTDTTAPPADQTASGTRTSTTPFASNSVFNLPFGSGAQWQPNSQLDSAGIAINSNATGYNEPVYNASSSDPMVTVIDLGLVDGNPGTYQVNIPSGAQPSYGSDASLSLVNPSTNTYDSFGQFQWTGANTATVDQASTEPLNGSGITQFNSDWDEGVGTLTQADLQAGTIDHMLRVQIPTTMAQSFNPNSTNQLAPNAWPQTAEDGFANNGDGGTPYTGTVPYGSTIGIPAGTPEPADVAANAGANMMWQALQDHGAMIRDTTGTDNAGELTFQTDQNVNPNDPLLQGMEQFGTEIMASAQILTNQGPNSINGGGTPIVPLDAPVSS